MLESTVKALGPGLAAVILAYACYGDDQAGNAEKDTNASIFVPAEPAPVPSGAGGPALSPTSSRARAIASPKPLPSNTVGRPALSSADVWTTDAHRVAPQLRLLATPFSDAIDVSLASRVAPFSESVTALHVYFALRGSHGDYCESELREAERRPGSGHVAYWQVSSNGPFGTAERCSFANGQSYRVFANIYFADGSVAVLQSEELVTDGAISQYQVEEELNALGFYWQPYELATAVDQSCGAFLRPEGDDGRPHFEIMTTQFLSIQPPQDNAGCWGHDENRLFFGRSPVWFASVPSEDPDDPIANRVQRAAFRRLRQAVTAAGFVVIER